MAGLIILFVKRLLAVMVGAASLGFATQVHAQQDERQKFPQVSTVSPHGVDLQSGRFTKEGVDLTIGPLTVDHYVNREMPAARANNGRKSVFATSLHGLSHRYTAPAAGGSNGTYVDVHLGQQVVKFNVLSNGSFFPFDSSTTGWKMVESGQNYTLSNKSGDAYVLNTHSALPPEQRRLTSMTSADGHKLSYTYDSSARLLTVTSNRGYAVRLQYSGNNVIVCGFNLSVTQLPSNCSSASYKVTYGRDSAGLLTSITGVDGAIVNISYVQWQNGTYIGCVSLPNSATCAILNEYTGVGQGGTNSDQVTKQTTAEGEVWNYDHIPVENNSGDYIPGLGEVRQSFGTMIPPEGLSTAATYGNGFVQRIQGPSGITTYQYATQQFYNILYKTGWDGPHYYSLFPYSISYPGGNGIIFARDWADNVISREEVPQPGPNIDNLKTTWTYPAANLFSNPTICNAANVLCDKPTKITDPEGNETDFTYSATHGGVLTKTEPAATNGIRPQTRYNYATRNAMIKSGSIYVAMQPPIHVLTSEEYCKTSEADASGNCSIAGDEVTTTYDYGPTSGPNNLLLRGTVVDSGGLNLRTCYLYDDKGRKIAETQPKGTGTSCP